MIKLLGIATLLASLGIVGIWMAVTRSAFHSELPVPSNFSAMVACASSLLRIVTPAPPPTPSHHDQALSDALSRSPEEQLDLYTAWLHSGSLTWEAIHGLLILNSRPDAHSRSLRSAVPALLFALNSFSSCPITPDSESKRLACMDTLTAITGAAPGTTYEAWAAWWADHR